jgi:putative transposase
MARTRRVSPDNGIHHVLNRGNRKERIFHNSGDYSRFLNLVADALERTPLRLLAFCVMPNHFHMVVRAESGAALPAYMEWLTSTHVRQHHRQYHTTGQGHIYQERYKNFLIQRDEHLYTVLRYVEANALRAGLVDRAEDWRWSSAADLKSPDGRQLVSDWPVPRPRDWLRYVNRGIPAEELASLRVCARRGRPYGDQGWVTSTATEYGLESTLRPRGHQPTGPDAVRACPQWQNVAPNS